MRSEWLAEAYAHRVLKDLKAQRIFGFYSKTDA